MQYDLLGVTEELNKHALVINKRTQMFHIEIKVVGLDALKADGGKAVQLQ
jgi:hypothetical protein